MKIRVVDYFWSENDYSGSESFIFKEKNWAILSAQELLDCEHNERCLSDEYFLTKEEMYIDYYERNIEQYRFIIKVQQKEIG